jgi:poly-gamma-glutamate synthesis protein (capsule biosynthesis protein)
MDNIDTLDWENGYWENDTAPKAQAELLIASDWAPIRAYSDIILNNPESVYGDLMPALRQSDLRIVNLECPLIAGESPVWKSGSVLKGSENHVTGLTTVPFEVVTLGNNHVFDHGVDAFEKTLELLNNRGIKTVGAGMSANDAKRPLIVDVNKMRIAIISFSEGEDLTAAENGPGVFGWEIDEVVNIINQIKNTVDLIIVISHCGVEYIPFPPPYVAGAFQRIIDAGANLVIGHHPHVPQGIQIYHNCPICYSLGNFVFYQETDLQYRKIGFFIKVGIAKGSVVDLKSIPYRIQAEGLSLLKSGRYKWFFEKLKAVSTPLNDFANIDHAWHGFLRYYGKTGLRDELKMILNKLDDEPEKGAAMLRNRITTIQHYRHWIDMLTRIINDDIQSSPQWAYDLAEEWMTEKNSHPK